MLIIYDVIIDSYNDLLIYDLYLMIEVYVIYWVCFGCWMLSGEDSGNVKRR